MSRNRSLFAALRDALRTHDRQTGTLRQAAFENAVDAWLGGGAGTRRPSSSLMLVRIDWTTRGGRTEAPRPHECAAVFKTVAEIADGCLRTTDVLGRVGVDTLGILLPSTPAQQAEYVSKRIRAAVCQRTLKSGTPVTVSIGLATGLSPDPWRDAADAVTAAQHDGGDRTVVTAL